MKTPKQAPASGAPPNPHAAIVSTIRAIPRGTVSSYGEVARKAGLPGRARMVARLLSESVEPDLPWHRVLRSDGRIAMPEGSLGYIEQERRLRAEGVRVENGRAMSTKATQSLDELLWHPDA